MTTPTATDSVLTSSPVAKPSHYQLVPGVEAMDVIEAVLTHLALPPHQSYLMGNLLKYRLRAGNKDDATQDIAKADEHARRLTAIRDNAITQRAMLDSMRLFNAYSLHGKTFT